MPQSDDEKATSFFSLSPLSSGAAASQQFAISECLSGKKRPLAQSSETDTPTPTATATATPTTVNTATTSDNGTTAATTRTVMLADGDDPGANRSTGGSFVLPTTISRMRLQAIFYPKFDNEKSSSSQQQQGSIRDEMIHLCSLRLGYLEASVKHSGSLVLWSGSDNFYSKNSASWNRYSLAGHILLKQHFLRMAYCLRLYHNEENKSPLGATSSSASSNYKNDDEVAHLLNAGKQLYETCSQHILQNRLTLSFEVMTGGSMVWGDHGQRPLQDYLILTCVADRPREAFYSTSQLIAFAHEFALPHNDYYLFHGATASAQLFGLYDAHRTTGTASTVLPLLAQAATMHVPSMYPHSLYQGEILEGLVVRYVPTTHHGGESSSSSSTCANPDAALPAADVQDHTTTWAGLQRRAADVQARVQQYTPSHQQWIQHLSQCSTAVPRVYSTLLRSLIDEIQDAPPMGVVRMNQNDEDAVTKRLLELLELPPGVVFPSRVPKSRTVVVAGKANVGADKDDWVTALASRMIESSNRDTETARIARLLRTLCSRDNIRSGVDVALVATTTPTPTPLAYLADDSAATPIGCSLSRDDDGSPPESSSSVVPALQLVVHVLHDSVFARFEKMREPGAMKLFRGFVVELVDGEARPARREEPPVLSPLERQSLSLSKATLAMNLDDGDLKEASSGAMNNEVGSSSLSSSPEPPPLMLKLKLLPYMVRTFGIRNGLRVLRQGGPAEFLRYTGGLLRRWNMPPKAAETWQRYFRAWALYATKHLQRDRNVAVLESSYLNHLETFDWQYFSDALPFPADPSQGFGAGCGFRGLVVVVAVQETAARAVAAVLARHLSGGDVGLPTTQSLAQVTPEKVWLSCEPGCGIVVSAQPTSHLGAMRKLVKGGRQNSSSSPPPGSISVVLVGCTVEDIEASESIPCEKEKKKLLGILNAWRKLDCGALLELPRLIEDGSVDESTTVLGDALAALRAAGEALPIPDSRIGVLVFCPGIPGCGKSSLMSETNCQSIRSFLESLDKTNPRNLLVVAGDQVKDKFWPRVVCEKLQDPSSVLLADKNAPLPSWALVADASAKSKSLAAAISYPSALQTTTIKGARDTKGCVVGNQSHCYPFSLEFLAICMLRVLDRNAGCHEGRLDSGTARACLIVTKFFGFYRGLPAEEFEQRLSSHFELAGSALVLPSIPVPFMKSERREVPPDLFTVLDEALQVNFGCELARQDPSKQVSSYLDSLEQRLRTELDRHRTTVQSLTVDEGTSRAVFCAKLMEVVADVENRSRRETSGEPARPFVTLAAIDVDSDAIQGLLRTIFDDPRFRSFWLITNGRNNSGIAVSKDACMDATSLWTKKPHVTMIHFSQADQDRIYSVFAPLEGYRVKVRATSVVWSQRIAALAVSVAGTTLHGGDEQQENDASMELAAVRSVPRPRNDFVHITLWRTDDASAVEANALPTLVESNQAERVELFPQVEFAGVFRLWTR